MGARNNFVLILIALIFFLIGFGVAWFIWGGDGLGFNSGVLPEGDDTGVSSPSVLVGDNAIAVFDQTPGEVVEVSFVVLARDGWVVVHEDSQGRPGNILGARRFDRGKYESGGTVELLRPTREGGTYYGMLHYDDGDREFDFTKDLPVTDDEGNIIVMEFVASFHPQE